MATLTHGLLQSIGGYKIFIDKMIKYKTVKRTWKERLFTLPWEPLTKFKSIHDGYLLEDGKLIGHGDMMACNPKTWDAIKNSDQFYEKPGGVN